MTPQPRDEMRDYQGRDLLAGKDRASGRGRRIDQERDDEPDSRD